MNIVIVNSSDTFEERIDMVYEFFEKRGDKVTVLASDFMHIEKKKRKIRKNGYIAVETKPYRKNISLARLYSHYDFTSKCLKLLKGMEFTLLYIVVPPNSQAEIAKKYYKNKNIKIIMDIIDMWPESLPIKGTGRFPFSLWGNIRNYNLKYADYIITECNLYQRKLGKWINNKKVSTVYWAHKNNNIGDNTMTVELPQKELHLCYLGSINNIIDIAEIGRIIGELSKEIKVVLKIIGGGEKKDVLIEEVKKQGAEVINYGKIYDFQKKKEIMDTCHYGLNIMKDTVCVGLSMKSIDYWECGLPIINNLSGDTKEIVEKGNCGVNISEDSWKQKVLECDVSLKSCSSLVFQKYFTAKALEENMRKLIES